jgi:HAMP domain-containing protein
MNPRAQIRVGLAAKLALCVIASTAVFFTLFGFLNLRMERAQSEDLVRQSAQRVTDVILRSTRYEMLRNDREALYNVIQELGSEPGIQRIRIFNKEGRITVSTDARERNLVVDKTAEQCFACHSQSAPLSKLSRPDRARIFIDRQGHRVLGVIQPIANSAECSGASCHVHPPGQTVLGVVDADLSLATVDAQMAAHQASLKWFLAGAIVFGCLAAILFMWIVVYRPVKALIDGTHRVAGGDLNYRLPVQSEDELGDLARSFNRMTAKVAGAQGEIEEQVRRKTAELERVYKTLLSNEKMASIGKLAATVAHEINNPLFGILTYARLVLREIQKQEFPRHRARKQALRRPGEESAHLLAPGAEPSRAERSERHRAARRPAGQAQAGHAEYRSAGEFRGQPAACRLRRQSNPAGGAGVAGERIRGHAPWRDHRSSDGIRCRRRTRGGAGERHGQRHTGRRAGAHFRSVLYDQGRPEPHGTGPGGGTLHRGAARRRDHGTDPGG